MSELQFASLPQTESRLARIQDWLRENCPVEDFVDLDTDLIDTELLTSLKFVELVLFVEELRGTEIPDAERELDRFRTLRSIATHYL